MHSEIENLFSLRGKTAMITGGARDLGRDAASILAAAGCSVIVTSRESARAEAAANELATLYGVRTLPLMLDQRDAGAVARCCEEAIAWAGQIDILVNNAGGGTPGLPGNLFDRTPEMIRDLIDTNLTGVIFCCREIGRHMAERGSGRIINIASMAGLMGRDRRMYQQSGMKGQPVEYAAAKAGVIGLTMDLAGFLSPMGVRVNTISPGGFERRQPPEFIRLYSDRTPLRRMGRDGIDLKGAILFLASPASDYVTGANLVVDGGFSIWH